MILQSPCAALLAPLRFAGADLWLMSSTFALQAGHVLQNLELTTHNPFSNETFSRVASLLRQATAAV